MASLFLELMGVLSDRRRPVAGLRAAFVCCRAHPVRFSSHLLGAHFVSTSIFSL